MTDTSANDEAAAAPPPKRQRKRRRAQHNPFVVGMSFVLTMALLGTVVLGGLVYWGKGEFIAQGPLAEDKTVIIPAGASLARISSLLDDEGAIANPFLFETGVKIYGNTAKLRAGEYEIAAGSSMRAVMDRLVSGRSIQHKIPFPEGYSSLQVVQNLKDNAVLVGEVAEIPEEGSLLPDTYVFTRGTTRQDLVDRMKAAHDEAVAEIWETRAPDLPLESPRELVILASIVEKETGIDGERGDVAGVFINRLRKGQRLESDPTILYGLYQGEAWMRPRGGIKRSELDAPNDYSTYQIPALPPGPIANPGVDALKAVANPSEHGYYFFVADGSGGHAFATTYDEHLKNVAKWRDIERQKREAAKELQDVAPASSGD